MQPATRQLAGLLFEQSCAGLCFETCFLNNLDLERLKKASVEKQQQQRKKKLRTKDLEILEASLQAIVRSISKHFKVIS